MASRFMTSCERIGARQLGTSQGNFAASIETYFIFISAENNLTEVDIASGRERVSGCLYFASFD